MKQRLIEDLCGWVLIALFCFFFAACSPQKRLNRLISNNPELAKTDTVYTVKETELPGFHLDTTFKASTNVNGLSDILDNYKDYIDSVSRIKLYSQVTNYITNRSCLDDTLHIKLDNGGYCKIWQSKGLFYYQLNQPPRKLTFRVPVTVSQYQVTEKNNWKMFWIGVTSGLVFIALVNIVMGKFSTKT